MSPRKKLKTEQPEFEDISSITHLDFPPSKEISEFEYMFVLQNNELVPVDEYNEAEIDQDVDFLLQNSDICDRENTFQELTPLICDRQEQEKGLLSADIAASPNTEPKKLRVTDRNKTKPKSIGGTSCAALNCTNRLYTHPTIHFYCFPRDIERCLMWIENCGRVDLKTKTAEQLNKNYRLCSEHFADKEFTCSDKARINFNAVPTLFNFNSVKGFKWKRFSSNVLKTIQKDGVKHSSLNIPDKSVCTDSKDDNTEPKLDHEKDLIEIDGNDILADLTDEDTVTPECHPDSSVLTDSLKDEVNKLKLNVKSLSAENLKLKEIIKVQHNQLQLFQNQISRLEETAANLCV